MRANLLCCISVVAVIACLMVLAAPRHTHSSPARKELGANASTLSELVASLEDDRAEQRIKALEALRNEHKEVVLELIRIVDTSVEEGRSSPRVLAARLLGEWHVIAAVPALSRNLDCEIVVFTDEVRNVYLELYPCADALSKMGPSALNPTLTAIANQSEPMTPKCVRVAAYLIVSLCDNSKEGAITAIRKAEKLYPESKNLHPIRMYIEHIMDSYIDIELQRADPSA